MGGRAVVSFADGAGDYRGKLQRLGDSLKGNFDGDFLGFTDYKQIGSPKHSEIPYAFKPYAIQKAIDLGYDQILWADSCVVAKQNIQPVFDHIEKHGYVFFDNIGHSLGTWCNDRTLKHFSIDRQDSFGIQQIMACCYGLNFNRDFVVSLFKQYKTVNLYRGKWHNADRTESNDTRVKGHRHDQAVMSAVLHNHKALILKGQESFFAYSSHKGVLPIADSVCLFSE
jgi:hypothetical protein